MTTTRCSIDGCLYDGEWVRVHWIGPGYPLQLCGHHWSDLSLRRPDEAAFYMRYARQPRRHMAARPRQHAAPALRLVDTREERLTAAGW